jgi:uncharacterized membrane protein
MFKNLFGVTGIVLANQLAEPIMGLNKSTAEFLASVVFFVAMRLYDEWKTRKKIADLKYQHEKELSIINNNNNNNKQSE